MGYSVSDGQVRVDIFKPSGKWDHSVAVDMDAFYNFGAVHDAVEQAFRNSGYTMWADNTYVCLEPYHKHAHPVMLKNRGRK